MNGTVNSWMFFRQHQPRCDYHRRRLAMRSAGGDGQKDRGTNAKGTVPGGTLLHRILTTTTPIDSLKGRRQSGNSNLVTGSSSPFHSDCGSPPS
ncbi:hypothetical protein EmuJ_001114100 [Echinococcus multilocularis]|uniref:Uncharacterized protein n=1 Tax=Echinococcus multilocularis TaxID=6211 RepID=A0A068YMS9_ECHMU|nr:hypothetical protein EmuJ_001114100 [Echinococcus multilocularis]